MTRGNNIESSSSPQEVQRLKVSEDLFFHGVGGSTLFSETQDFGEVTTSTEYARLEVVPQEPDASHRVGDTALREQARVA